MEAKVISQVFNGHHVRQRSSDGYLSATDMCKVFNKLFGNYKQLKQTNEFLTALSIDIGVPAGDLIDIKQGGKITPEQGSWIHPRAAIDLAYWLSPTFAVQVCTWVSRFINGDITLAGEVVARHEEVSNTKILNIEIDHEREQLNLDERRLTTCKLEAEIARLNAETAKINMELEERRLAIRRTTIELDQLGDPELLLVTRTERRMACAVKIDALKESDPRMWQLLRGNFINENMPTGDTLGLLTNTTSTGPAEPNLLNNVDITTMGREALGRVPTNGEKCAMGKIVKKAYIAKHGHEPAQGPKDVNEATRQVYIYPATDREWIVEAIKTHYANKPTTTPTTKVIKPKKKPQ